MALGFRSLTYTSRVTLAEPDGRGMSVSSRNGSVRACWHLPTSHSASRKSHLHAAGRMQVVVEANPRCAGSGHTWGGVAWAKLPTAQGERPAYRDRTAAFDHVHARKAWASKQPGTCACGVAHNGRDEPWGGCGQGARPAGRECATCVQDTTTGVAMKMHGACSAHAAFCAGITGQ
jgi:hypothetical protein